MTSRPTPSGRKRTNCSFPHSSSLFIYLKAYHVFPQFSVLSTGSAKVMCSKTLIITAIFFSKYPYFSCAEPKTGHTLLAQLSRAGFLCMSLAFSYLYGPAWRLPLLQRQDIMDSYSAYDPWQPFHPFLQHSQLPNSSQFCNSEVDYVEVLQQCTCYQTTSYFFHRAPILSPTSMTVFIPPSNFISSSNAVITFFISSWMSNGPSVIPCTSTHIKYIFPQPVLQLP